jgi:hypothetical protein
MGKDTKLTLENLEKLGVKRLAQLLHEAALAVPTIKRSLATELAATGGTKQAASEIRKRLKALARSKAFVDWQNRGNLRDDLNAQLHLIELHISGQDAAEAADLLWEFMALANSVFERCDDSSGTIIGIFKQAIVMLGEVAVRAKTDPGSLANKVSDCALINNYGQFDGVIPALQTALGSEGLNCLKRAMQEVLAEEKAAIPKSEQKVFGWSSQGPIYQHDIRHSTRKRSAQMALRDIADAEGDADAFAASYEAKTKKVPAIAADIAERLLKAGRQEEALAVLNGADRDEKKSGKHDLMDFIQPDLSWEDIMIKTLEAMAEKNKAQAMRWQCFERYLSARHLREHLKKLEDFEDSEAEGRALKFVENHEIHKLALWFLVKWPALHHAARLVLRHAGKWDGNSYETLTQAAEALSGRHPLAATVLLRAMIDDTLKNARSTRYKHAARHLLECSSLAAKIGDHHGQQTHEAFVQAIKSAHAKKASFWVNVNL